MIYAVQILQGKGEARIQTETNHSRYICEWSIAWTGDIFECSSKAHLMECLWWTFWSGNRSTDSEGANAGCVYHCMLYTADASLSLSSSSPSSFVSSSSSWSYSSSSRSLSSSQASSSSSSLSFSFIFLVYSFMTTIIIFFLFTLIIILLYHILIV